MTFADVQAALDKGTVILNAAGAHIPKLAGPSLAVTDAVALPCALNMYVTAAGKRTSAPPHTDKQDVCVVQTAGCKHWKVFAPPDAAMKPAADIFARGKGDDSMPLYALSETTELLLETTLYPGDVLFVPAGFPHTTSTVGSDDADTADETSVHLTLGIDHHIWELDFLSVRRVAYRRACITDTTLGTGGAESNPFTGPVNQLPFDILADVMAELPLGFLEDEGFVVEMVDQVAKEAESIARKIDPECSVDAATWKETVQRIRRQGVELLETHRDMYLAALEEGRIREAEDAMTAHLMTPERMQRLSLFRVKRYYDQINDSKQRLKEWSFRGKAAELTASSDGALSSDWAFTMPVVVGDQVEADLGGAFFPAKVTRASDGTYDVAFFDGDRETGLARRQIKLLSPPKTAAAASLDEVDTSNMTAKQLKRWKKEQEKLQKNGL
jgi:Cupin superfamily protein